MTTLLHCNNQHPPPPGTYNVLGLRHCPARLDGVALAMLLGVLPTPRLVGVPVQSVLSESILTGLSTSSDLWD